MSTILSNVSQKIAGRLFPSYFTATLVTSVIYVSMLLGWDLRVVINPTIMLVLAISSGFIQRFLGGIGIFITFIIVTQFGFRFFSNFIKGRPLRAKRIKALFFILGGIIGAYAIYRIAAILFFANPITIIGIGFNLYGFWFTIIWVYFLPIIRREYQLMEEDGGIIDEVRDGLQELRYSLWKGYQQKIAKDYGKVYAAEYARLGDELVKIRNQLGGLLLFPITIILLIFPPLVGVAIILWLRVFSVDKFPFTKGERILLLIVCGAILAFSLFSFFTLDIGLQNFYFSLAFASGILCGIILTGYLLLKA